MLNYAGNGWICKGRCDLQEYQHVFNWPCTFFNKKQKVPESCSMLSGLKLWLTTPYPKELSLSPSKGTKDPSILCKWFRRVKRASFGTSLPSLQDREATDRLSTRESKSINLKNSEVAEGFCRTAKTSEEIATNWRCHFGDPDRACWKVHQTGPICFFDSAHTPRAI